MPRQLLDSSPRGRSTFDQKENAWTPKGILVAHFLEHSASINMIRVSPDQSYFITGSDDGTIRLWDTRRLETNVVNRSRIVYSGLGMFLIILQSLSRLIVAIQEGKSRPWCSLKIAMRSLQRQTQAKYISAEFPLIAKMEYRNCQAASL